MLIARAEVAEASRRRCLRYHRESRVDGGCFETGIAHSAADKLMDTMEFTEDPKFLLEAVDKTLGKLGYGAKGNVNNFFGEGANVQQNTVTANVLEQALARRKEAQGLQASTPDDEGEGAALNPDGSIEGSCSDDD